MRPEDTALTTKLPASDQLIPLPSVQARLGDVSRQTIWRWSTAGRFPRPVRLGTRSMWCAREVDAWISDRLDERGGE